MIELFPDIPSYVRKVTDFWIARAKEQPNLLSAAQMLKDCRDRMPTEEAKEYFDFAVRCQLLDIEEEK